jgi:hypothetical protein
MKFFLRFKIYELMKNMGTKFYIYHHIIAISTPMNWFGPRLRDITIATLAKMGLEWKM